MFGIWYLFLLMNLLICLESSVNLTVQSFLRLLRLD